MEELIGTLLATQLAGFYRTAGGKMPATGAIWLTRSASRYDAVGQRPHRFHEVGLQMARYPPCRAVGCRVRIDRRMVDLELVVLRTSREADRGSGDQQRGTERDCAGSDFPIFVGFFNNSSRTVESIVINVTARLPERSTNILTYRSYVETDRIIEPRTGVGSCWKFSVRDEYRTDPQVSKAIYSGRFRRIGLRSHRGQAESGRDGAARQCRPVGRHSLRTLRFERGHTNHHRSPPNGGRDVARKILSSIASG